MTGSHSKGTTRLRGIMDSCQGRQVRTKDMVTCRPHVTMIVCSTNDRDLQQRRVHRNTSEVDIGNVRLKDLAKKQDSGYVPRHVGVVRPLYPRRAQAIFLLPIKKVAILGTSTTRIIAGTGTPTLEGTLYYYLVPETDAVFVAHDEGHLPGRSIRDVASRFEGPLLPGMALIQVSRMTQSNRIRVLPIAWQVEAKLSLGIHRRILRAEFDATIGLRLMGHPMLSIAYFSWRCQCFNARMWAR